MASSPDALTGRVVLVTGGAGYVGSHTCVQLLAAGAQVVVVDNLDNASPTVLDRIREVADVGADDGRLVFAEVDIRDRLGLDEVFVAHDVDAVIHFAGLKAVGESVEVPRRYWDNNVVGTISLLAVMADHGVHDLVFSSSATVYGDPATVPVPEAAPLSALNPYGRTKLVVEDLLRDAAAATGAEQAPWRIVLLRYFNPVGAHPSGRMGEDPRGIPNNLMPFIMQVAVGRHPHLSVFGDDYDTPDGTCIRDYIHVMDLADAHLAALGALDRMEGCTAVNVGTGTGTSVLEALAAASRAVGREIPHEIVARRPGDAPRAFADTTLAAEVLGWRAQRDLDDMVRDHWRWQRENPGGYDGAPS